MQPLYSDVFNVVAACVENNSQRGRLISSLEHADVLPGQPLRSAATASITLVWTTHNSTQRLSSRSPMFAPINTVLLVSAHLSNGPLRICQRWQLWCVQRYSYLTR